MAKATVQNLLDAGFRPEQFGSPPDFEGDTGYLGKVLTVSGRWAEQRFGLAAYAVVAAPSFVHDALAHAETYHASAQLWRRRVGFLDANAMASRDAGFEYLNRREMLAHASECDDQAELWIGKAIDGPASVDGSAIAVGLVESGRFDPIVDGAVTA